MNKKRKKKILMKGKGQMAQLFIYNIHTYVYILFTHPQQSFRLSWESLNNF